MVLIRPGGVRAAAPAPIGAYLKSVRVAGFRGVGTAPTVPLHPGPGLTVITGRNGSGKSSIAEALEMALTGSSYRWSKQLNAVWTADWRNLHGDVPAEIRGRARRGRSGRDDHRRRLVVRRRLTDGALTQPRSATRAGSGVGLPGQVWPPVAESVLDVTLGEQRYALDIDGGMALCRIDRPRRDQLCGV